MSCQFCGSKEIKIPRDEVKLGNSMDANGEIAYVTVTDWCCNAQKVNAAYIKKNFHPDDAPDEESVSKL